MSSNKDSPFSTREKRSPIFENLSQNKKVLQQAFYNAAVNLLIVIVILCAAAVYYILQTFWRPLLWAILCGTFLHPFKSLFCNVVKGWFTKLKVENTPLTVGLCFLPIHLISSFFRYTYHSAVINIKAIVITFVGFIFTYIIYNSGIFYLSVYVFNISISALYIVLEYFSSMWIWTLFLGYIILILFYWSPSTSNILKYLSIPMWICFLFHLTNIAGQYRAPICICIGLLLCIGFFNEFKEANKDKGIGLGTAFRLAMGDDPLVAKLGNGGIDDVNYVDNIAEVNKDSTDGIFGIPISPLGRPSKLKLTTNSKNGDKLSRKCFKVLFVMIILVKMWKNFLLVLQLTPLILVFFVFKHLLFKIIPWERFISHLVSGRDVVLQDPRLDIVVPKPIRGLVKILLRGDRKLRSIVDKSMDSVISVLIILLLLVGTVLLMTFTAVQIHRESMHLVSITSNLLNKTLDHGMRSWLPDGEDLQHALDSMAGNAYLYSRTWVISKVHIAVTGEQQKQVEQQILKILDSFYENWFSVNMLGHDDTTRSCPLGVEPTYCVKTMQTKINEKNLEIVNHPVVDNIPATASESKSPITLYFHSLKDSWAGISKFTNRSNFINDIIAFFNENIGMILSVLESIWSVLLGNVNLAITFLMTICSLLFSGGSALLNFIVSGVIFFTTLFYLLASSGSVYKPIEWFSSLAPVLGINNKYGLAFEDAISSVFAASLKMAVFYGIYTWLTHTIFEVNIVFIPSAIAAIFGAVPFLGTYWAALPAIIELWIMNGDKVNAGLLFICHLIPTYFVDTAIYSDIKGGHPYLTGLAIAGGVYCLGLEGAIIGPVLLCCLIVAINAYSTIFKSSQTDTPIIDRS